MPIYEYECNACGHRMEALQSMSDDPLEQCPACQALALRKLVSAASFKLKGQGWYESDFKKPASTQNNTGKGDVEKSGEKKDAPAGQSGSSDSSGDVAKAAEKKSATTPDAKPSAPKAKAKDA